LLRYVVKRLLLALLTLSVISVITFTLFFAVPTNAAEVMCGEAKACSAQKIATIERRLGLDQPIHVQYSEYMKGIFVGRTFSDRGIDPEQCPAPCLGYSFFYDDPVTEVLGRTLPVTVSIVIGALLVQLLGGVTIGMISALRRGTVFDRAAVGTSLVGASMQIYFLGYLLLIILVYQSGLLPNPGYRPFLESPLAWAGGLILPWLTLGFINSAVYARLSRAQMLETLSEDFVRTARAKGLPKRTVYIRHALRAAITPVVTIAGLDFGTALGGTVITETVFGLNGLGRAAVNAVNQLDTPVVMATVLLAAVFIVVMNIVVDLLYAVIDPRVRLG
jgi:peptide/nickel transport system permease protein